jgi:UDP-N-acetylmuramoyl-L-alanyl-D-glutamate--2,6-diaminopimelate ligase
MRLDQLMAVLDDATLVRGDLGVEIDSVEIDSREASTGTLFCCVVGSHDDGHNHALEAIERGAVAVVTEREVEALAGEAAAEIRVHPGAGRLACAALSAQIVGHPAERLSVIGVTGTNGKTTVVTMVSEILQHAGFVTTMIGTLTGARTTPAAPELHRIFAEAENLAASLGRSGAVAMEVSSHALDQERVAGVRFSVAVFTNLSQDHLDYHGSMEAYFDAKARLFADDVADVAVIWAETEEGRALLERRAGPSVAVSWSDAAELEIHTGGSRFTWRGHEIELGLLGSTSTIDALLAAEAAVALGIEPALVAEALGSFRPVRGRMELVGGAPGSPLVVVDYAHTPDALRAALEAARQLAVGGEVIVVFGCGGDRDVAKRPVMGAVASELADVVIVTTDNPRHEDPSEISRAVVAGATGRARVLEISSRDLAIRAAIEDASSTDVVLIAGKGHETTQVFADRIVDFDDRAVALGVLGEPRGER